MTNNRFDELTKTLSKSASRRALLKGAAPGAQARNPEPCVTSRLRTRELVGANGTPSGIRTRDLRLERAVS